MPSRTLLLALAGALAVALSHPAPAAELWVDAAAPASGDGSAGKPFRTLTEAAKAASGGDVITLRRGTYRESVALDKGGTADRPTVLRAAPGERAILSGFAPVTGWQVHRDNVYAATFDGPVDDLFVGYVTQPVARWPDANAPWRYIKSADPAANTLADRDPLPAGAPLAEIAARPAGARIYLYVGQGNFFRDVPLTRLDVPTGVLAAGANRTLAGIKGQKDRYHVVNHVALVRAPGQWAAEPLDGQRTRVYFWPAKAEDLHRTQVRRLAGPLVRIGHWKNTVPHVRLEGLELTGSRSEGIELGRAEHVVVTRCLAHHNAGNGIAARRSAFLEFTENLVLANGNGLGIASSHDVLVQRNEIALNMVDGLTVAGNVSGKPDGEPTTQTVTVRRNYIHHHLLMGHPDNVQTYRGVEKLTLEDNVLLWGGQGIMTEETNNSTVRNCVVVGTEAVAVIFGHANASDWTVERSTVGLGGWGALSMTAKGYQLNHNIFFQNAHSLGENVASDYNLYAMPGDDQSVLLVTKPKWKRFTKVEDAAAATGQATHSLRADPQFRAAPARQAMALWHDENARDRLFVRQVNGENPTEGFAAGDRIEFNGDGVLRRVNAVDDKSLRFDPPLPQVPLRGGLVWNWKNAAGTALDLRPRDGSPALKAGKDGTPVGADLDIPAFQRGDFDGDGKRDLPDVPDDVRAGWPNPSGVVLPLHGS